MRRMNIAGVSAKGTITTMRITGLNNGLSKDLVSNLFVSSSSTPQSYSMLLLYFSCSCRCCCLLRLLYLCGRAFGTNLCWQTSLESCDGPSSFVAHHPLCIRTRFLKGIDPSAVVVVLVRAEWTVCLQQEVRTDPIKELLDQKQKP